MGFRIDLTGKRFGRLIVVSPAENPNVTSKDRGTYWLCKCDCGNEKIVFGGHLRSGGIKSCGCLRGEILGLSATTHGLSRSRLYGIHKDMNRRCYNKKNKSYADYGGRGIKVCEEWRGTNGFKSFYDWAIDNGYSIGLTIDRIDTNGDYSPDNCKWSSVLEQANNKRNNVRVTINGETKTRAEWSRIYGINYHTVCSRMNKGVDPVTALITPVGKI